MDGLEVGWVSVNLRVGVVVVVDGCLVHSGGF